MGGGLFRRAAHANSLSDVDKSNLYLLQKQTDKGTQVVKQFERQKIEGQYYCKVIGSINECFNNNQKITLKS